MNDILNYDPFIREYWNLFARLSVDVLAFQTIGKPRATGKVHSFPDVQTRAEASMVAPWECQYELAWFLQCFIHPNLKV